ncbi:MAG: hypothetical protein APR63_12385 [Desulfuromonas sp. SDB]|nr:MAG: hypothetical protein APR63_12385 [Desulfuromonas sp. SDB]
MKSKIKLSLGLLFLMTNFIFPENYILKIDSMVLLIDEKIADQDLYQRNIEYGYTVIPGIGHTRTETTIFYDMVERFENDDLRHDEVIFKIINIYFYSRFFSHEQIYYSPDGSPLYVNARIYNNMTESTDDVLYQEKYYFHENQPLKVIIQNQEYTQITDSVWIFARDYYQHCMNLLENVQNYPLSIPPIQSNYPEEF